MSYISTFHTHTIDLDGTSGRFSVHALWASESRWYFDAGGYTNARAASVLNPTTVRSRTVFGGYKSTAAGNNCFRLNKGTRYQSSSTAVATVSGGITINNNWGQGRDVIITFMGYVCLVRRLARPMRPIWRTIFDFDKCSFIFFFF